MPNFSVLLLFLCFILHFPRPHVSSHTCHVCTSPTDHHSTIHILPSDFRPHLHLWFHFIRYPFTWDHLVSSWRDRPSSSPLAWRQENRTSERARFPFIVKMNAFWSPRTSTSFEVVKVESIKSHLCSTKSLERCIISLRDHYQLISFPW
jgi:hypothetical protein